MRILVVDDDAVICHTLRAILATQQHEVTAVFTGAGAIEALEGGGDFDVALVDWTLPDTTGPEVMARIREVCPRTRVCISTGQEAYVVKQALGENQADAVIPKPFAVKELLAIIAGLIPDGPAEQA
jgi:DNA-binding response OmpR family regulator